MNKWHSRVADAELFNKSIFITIVSLGIVLVIKTIRSWE